MDLNCFAKFYTEADIEDFRNIARQFANFSESPITLQIDTKGKHIYPQQYMTSIGGSSAGRIKLLDLDVNETCQNRETLSNGEDCTYDTALRTNCKIMAELTNIPNLNCSMPASTTSRTTLAPNYSTDCINASHAVLECRKQCKIDRKKD